jgi:glyoxylase-like metal-dependent hydrolase (beta-lactamase superfamily II)
MLERMRTFFWKVLLLMTAALLPAMAQGPKLYIMDCGTIGEMDMKLYNLTKEEVKGPLDLVNICYLIVHPRGTLLWDSGYIPDSAFPANGGPAKNGVFAATKKLTTQLAEIGYKPEQITYLGLSHYHSDHTGNANLFAGSTWIVQESEYEAMFGGQQRGIQERSSYEKLKDAKRITLKNEDRDVFGDGTVVIKTAPGHTPGHQMLFLKLAKFGPVLLAGDLYHFPEEKTLDRVPTFDGDAAMTRATRKKVDEFVKQTGAQMWIEHDKTTHEKLKKAPQFYE